MFLQQTLFVGILAFYLTALPGAAIPAEAPDMEQNGSSGQAAPAERAFIMVAGEAEWGNPQAMLTLGEFYETGVGIGRNFGKAREWYEKAAMAGLPEAVYRVGLSWETGMGSAVNMQQAIELYQKAADLGSAPAMYRLATLHQRGYFLPQNDAWAAQFLEKAAAAGHAEAMGDLGIVYLNGLLGLKKDSGKAIGLLSKAAESGSLASMYNLALVFKDGRGTTASPVKAVKWFLIALNSGYPQEAIRPALDQQIDGMASEQVQQGEAEAEAWLKSRQSTRQPQ